MTSHKVVIREGIDIFATKFMSPGKGLLSQRHARPHREGGVLVRLYPDAVRRRES
jgi:hypothetical protein